MTYTKTNFSRDEYPWRVTHNGITINESTTYVGFQGTKTGSSVPGYRKIIADGGDATSSYSADFSRLILKESGSISASGIGAPPPPGFEGAYSRGSLNQTMTGFGSPEFGVVGHLIANTLEADARALKQIYRKIESEQSHLAGASVLAEGADVLRQFGAPFNSLVDLTNRRLNRLELEKRGLKGTTSFKRVKWASIVASTYLEYVFGLEPLISDTQKAAEAYARWHLEAAESPQLRSRVKGRGSETTVTSSSTHVRPGNSTVLRFLSTDRTATTDRVQYVCGLKATPIANIGSNDRLIELLGFKPRKWIPAIWEVVPWSFLVDYVSNVGDILEAASVDVSGVTWCARTRSQRTVRHITTVHDKAFAAEWLTGLGFGWDMDIKGDHAGRLTRIRTSMSRAPSSLSVPPLVVDFKLNTKQMVNVGALLLARRPSASKLWLF